MLKVSKGQKMAANDDKFICELQRLRKVWAAYVDGIVSRAGKRPGRVVGMSDVPSSGLPFEAWTRKIAKAGTVGPRVYVDPQGVRWQVGVAALPACNTRWLALCGKVQAELEFRLQERATKEMARYMAERAGAVDVVPFQHNPDDCQALEYESSGFGILPACCVSDDYDQTREYAINGKNPTTGTKLEIWFVAVSVRKNNE